MKKFLMVLCLGFLVQTSANATYEVKYMNTGDVIRSTPVEFGQNAAFTPANRAKAGAKNRQIKYEKQYYENLNKPRNININLNTITKEETASQQATEEPRTEVQTETETKTKTKNQVEKVTPKVIKTVY